MFCKNCGNQVDDNAAFCPNCGTVLNNQQPATAAHAQSPLEDNNSNLQSQGELSMKWYRFLINFALFASAFLNLANSIMCFTGSQYGEGKDLVYLVLDGLKTVDILMGIACLGLVALDIYTRFRLAKYCKNGPKILTINYSVTTAVSLLYLIAVMIIVSDIADPGEIISSSNIASIVTSIVMIFVNRAYFNKRRHMFVN